MRFSWIVFLMSLFSCSKSEQPSTGMQGQPTKRDNSIAAQKLATEDLFAITSAAHLPGEWRVQLWWDSARKATVADVQLLFATDPSDPLAEQPYISADQFQVEVGPPARIVSHADPDKLRQVVSQASQVQIALDLARPELKTFERYQSWKKKQRRYTTRASLLHEKGYVSITFNPYGITDNNIDYIIDPSSKSIVSHSIHIE